MSPFQMGMQKTMSAAASIPTFYYKDEFDVSLASSLRERIKKESGRPITLMTLFVKTFSLALRKYPILNSHYFPERPFEFVQQPHHNVTVAIDSPHGLAVPNIKQVERLSMWEVQAELDRIKNLAKEGRLGAADLAGGSISMSNIGVIGGTYLGPIILIPQVCIVGIGKTVTVPLWTDNSWQPRQVVNVSLGCDHRVLDGATVARFSNEWKRLIEQPERALFEMV